MGQWVPPPGWLPYAYPPVAAPYKGARYGRPASGPGSLASPGRRFGARVLDGLLIGMVFITLAALALVLAIPHIGKVFPDTSYDRADDNRIPGFVWLELLFLAVQGVTTIVGVLYEAWVTAATGRTLGKRWLRIRAVGVDGSALGTGKSFGRAALYAASGLLGWVGLINVLWCLWDGDRQCVHDKIVQTLVVN
ncbi:MAG: hypothetical protein QOD72_3813, partial [Acidimicrobiaceae bacterium]|nr:hypothetical protein [Acidimicrobiaceae bacterium]